MTKRIILIGIVLLGFLSCTKQSNKQDNPDSKDLYADTPFIWENANLYFLLTDRFNNGDPSNDINFDRTLPTAPLRGFEGGDIKGITQKIKMDIFRTLASMPFGSLP